MYFVDFFGPLGKAAGADSPIPRRHGEPFFRPKFGNAADPSVFKGRTFEEQCQGFDGRHVV